MLLGNALMLQCHTTFVRVCNLISMFDTNFIKQLNYFSEILTPMLSVVILLIKNFEGNI